MAGSPRSRPQLLIQWLELRSEYVFALAMYVLLSILLTWPLAANFTTFVNGNVQDVYHELWYLRAFGTFGGATPFGPFNNFFTNQMLYPYGVPLYFQPTSPLNTIVVSFLGSLTGFVAAYNIVYLATFFVGAFTMFILARYLTGDKYAAFFAGIVYGFAPVHAAQALAHLNIISSELIPLFVYFMIKMVREQKFRNAILASVVLVLNAMLDLHQFLMCVTIFGLFLVFYLFWQRKAVLNKPYIKRFVLFAGVAFLLGVALYFNTFYGIFFAPRAFGTSAAATIPFHKHRSADLLQFFIPPSSNPLLGKFTFSQYQMIGNVADVETYFGWTALILALVGVAANFRQRRVLFFGFVAVIGFILALGPYIVISGNVTNIPGIWYYLYYLVPLFKSFRTPYRFDIIVMLGIAVLSAFGISKILSRMPRGSGTNSYSVRKIVLVAFVCGILVIEFLPIPYPELFAQPPAYLKILQADHSSYAVLDIPANVKDKVYLYYSTYYNQPILAGHVARTPPESLSFLIQTPFINLLGLKNQIKSGRSVLLNKTNLLGNYTPAQAQKVAPYILAQYNIKYIVLHRDLMSASLYNILENYIAQAIGSPVYTDPVITMFEFTPPSGMDLTQYAVQYNLPYFALLYGGWYKASSLNRTVVTGPHTGKSFLVQSMDYLAGVNVFASANEMMQVQFTMRSAGAVSYPIQVTINGQAIGTYMAYPSSAPPSGFTTYSTPFIQFSKGQNQVTFYSLNGCGPVAKPKPIGKTSLPSGCESAQFHSLSIIAAPPIPSTSRI